jgi:hypothetical protein
MCSSVVAGVLAMTHSTHRALDMGTKHQSYKHQHRVVCACICQGLVRHVSVACCMKRRQQGTSHLNCAASAQCTCRTREAAEQLAAKMARSNAADKRPGIIVTLRWHAEVLHNKAWCQPGVADTADTQQHGRDSYIEHRRFVMTMLFPSQLR